MVPAAIVNGAMLVSTIPEGGHHLIDLIVGGAIAIAAIALIRWPVRHTSKIVTAGSSTLAQA